MAAKRSVKKPSVKRASAKMAGAKTSKPKTAAAALGLVPKPMPCSRTFEFFSNVTVGPGQSHDSTTAQSVDCYQWLNVWVLAKHPSSMAMDNVTVELVFELPGKMGATGLANLGLPYSATVKPTPLQANSGATAGGYGGFVIRAPIIGPAVRAIVINQGAQTYAFSVWGYATH